MRNGEHYPGMDMPSAGHEADPARQAEQAMAERQAELKEHLKAYLEAEDAEAIEFMGMENLPREYREQYEFVDGDQERLKSVLIALVPKEQWHKGDQPTESQAERGLILFNADYFSEGDATAWMTHELAHCAIYESDPEGYSDAMDEFAFDDLAGEYSYPNNKVELEAFGAQFLFLKEKGVTHDDVRKMLERHYDDEDMIFLGRVLDGVYSSGS